MKNELWKNNEHLGEHASWQSPIQTYFWMLLGTEVQSRAIICFEKPPRSCCRHRDSIQGKLVIKEGSDDAVRSQFQNFSQASKSSA